MRAADYSNEIMSLTQKIHKESDPFRKSLLKRKRDGLDFRFQLELLTKLEDECVSKKPK